MRLPIILTIAAAGAAAPLSAQAPAAASAASPIWSAEGALEDSDARDEETRYDEHRLTLEAGRRYRISAASEAFDTIIRLYRPGQDEPVAQNDDFGGELNSRISYTPPASGDYVLRVTSFSEGGRGAYSARAEALPPLPPPSTARPSSTARTGWRIWDGRLDSRDPDRDGNYFEDHLVRLRAGETRLISVESADFDAMAWVLSPSDREGEPLASDDDAGIGFNALLAFRADRDGDYLVRVTSYSSGSGGAYRLRISDALTPPPLAQPDEPSEASAD